MSRSRQRTDPAKWLADGRPLQYTADGTHQTVAADDLLEAEFQSLLSGIAVTTMDSTTSGR